MPIIDFQGQRIDLLAAETVLDGLLRAGVVTPHSCRAGHCHACIVQAVDGNAPARSQEGLKDSWRARGLFLACRAVPQDDLRVAPAGGSGFEVGATVTDISRLSHDVVRLRLATDAAFEHRGGQFVTLVRPDGLARSYSTANLPDCEPFVELHVREVANGEMSGWIARDLQVGGRVTIRGPSGECFYVPGCPGQSLLLAGTGTGIAPLYSIVRQALRHEHHGRILFVQGAVDERGLYLVEELQQIARAHPNVEYVRCLLRGEATEGVEIAAIDAVVRTRAASLARWRVFLCGHPELVVDLRKKTFLAGASIKEIHADAFVMKSESSTSASRS